MDDIKMRLPISAHLGILAIIISNIIGIMGGVIAAARRGSLIDSIVTALGNLGITVPIFWLGILMMYALGLQLKWLPIFGYTSPFDDFWLSTKQIIMPVFCLAIPPIASAMRLTRSSMLEVMHQDYIRTAWSKGLKEQLVITKHALKNGLIPVVSFQGMAASQMIGGAVFVETIFSIPGLGRLAVESIFAHDYAVVQGVMLMASIIVVFSNLIVDLSYGWLDPRVRFG
jgi:peptide/nickel transport system permease protein